MINDLGNPDPVNRLDEVFSELGDDWSLLEKPEMTLLVVPEGTVLGILREIQLLERWPELYGLAEARSDQWKLDLSEFFPIEESFLAPSLRFLEMCKSDHARACFALEANRWAWSESNADLLPRAIQCVTEAREQICSGPLGPVASTLDQVIEQLSARLRKHPTGLSVPFQGPK